MSIQSCLTASSLLLVAGTFVEASRILGIYTIGAKSTNMYHTRMIETLVRRGHEVTVISQFSQSDSLLNYTLINFVDKPPDFVDTLLILDSTRGAFANLWPTYELQYENCKLMYTHEEVQKLLHSARKFDLVILELTALYCFLPLAFAFGAPVVGVNTGCTLFADIDYDASPASVPAVLSGFSARMDFSQRVGNTISYMIHWGFRVLDTHRGNTIARKYLRDPQPVEQLVDKISLFFVNSHSSFLPTPLAPNKILIGGIHINNSTVPLPAKIKDFIDSSPGTIYVSFGSVIQFSSMPARQHDAFVRVFSSLPYRVIWRHDRPGRVDNSSGNILVGHWFPQASILAAEKVVMFISHCGIMGTYEAIYFVKPLLCIPVDYDQFTNAAIVEQLQVGMQLDHRFIDEKLLRSGVVEMANNKQLRVNMQKLSSRFKDQPMTPADTFAYWIDYVIRYGNADHLQPASVQLSFYQYLLLDILLFGILVCILFLWFLKFIFRKCRSFLFRQVKKEKET